MSDIVKIVHVFVNSVREVKVNYKLPTGHPITTEGSPSIIEGFLLISSARAAFGRYHASIFQNLRPFFLLGRDSRFIRRASSLKGSQTCNIVKGFDSLRTYPTRIVGERSALETTLLL